MGRAMCEHLLRGGYRLRVYNRTVNKCKGLEPMGAVVCKNYREVAEGSDVVISMVGYPQDVEQVYLGEEGALKGLKPGSVIIDMTTSSPKTAKDLYATAREQYRVYALDAPVSGGDVGARDARLSIMAGGDREAFDAVYPLFEVMGKNIIYTGGPGTGK
ncbi:3-hydroxyisobutyrate dehydrogenase, partial [Cystoisospora suis]